VNKAIVPSLFLIVLTLCGCSASASESEGLGDITFTPGTTVDFAFESDGVTLSGIFDVPKGDTEALIVIVHSYGETDVRNWISYSPQRKRFNEMGIATVLWDKPGLGRSEGKFDINQPVHESAQEVLDAIAHLRRIEAPGTQKIGLWGGSRAGWIAPIALSQDSDIDFWISISGTSAEDNYTYLLLSNLPYEGGTPELAEQLESEWREGCRLFRTQGSFADYLKATETLRANEYITNMRGDWPNRMEYELRQLTCKDGSCPKMDNDLCEYVWIEDFDEMLLSLDIPVLALFGEKDLSVDWRKTKDLYVRTIGQNPNASLSVHSFPDADHGLNIAQTGSMKEMNALPQWMKVKTDGYFEVQETWLRNQLANTASR